MGIKATLATLAAVTAALGALGTGVAHADAGVEQQYLNIVRANGISAGQDDVLIQYAQEFCSTGGPFWDTVPALMGQGVFGSNTLYTLQVAATRSICPERIAIQPAPHYFIY